MERLIRVVAESGTATLKIPIPKSNRKKLPASELSKMTRITAPVSESVP